LYETKGAYETRTLSFYLKVGPGDFDAVKGGMGTSLVKRENLFRGGGGNSVDGTPTNVKREIKAGVETKGGGGRISHAGGGT